uniref:Uncharacterized protein n=1 Tax=Anguilla anguilla TaxID=7936 RepID=A0A0E9U2X0_ANGAN
MRTIKLTASDQQFKV